ncbi:MAG: Recombinase [candidate division TA06 bacterium 32_111]|uniref:Recombinase n=1 Tax=candidate division TA06 bacterium 34_109 TaxID=1635277 RepID=A0A101I3G2_UNCT6|nr:MAG: Recombinase [candidate division TA06 bacterium 32_111]KUK88068.1 MAG: Recombinase [candidate division TA06 bacterium 34_109]
MTQENNQTKKFFIYARKSTDSEDRQVRSINDQIAELKELAKKENLEIVDILVEKQTAKKPGRPVFAEMLKRIEAGEAGGILAWHPDRLARNSIDGGQIIYLVDTGIIKELKFPTFWFDPTPQGKFMLSIAFGQSKYYVDNLSENIKRGHRQKLKNGLWPQMAPLGYLNNKETKQIYVDKEKSPLIKKAFETYATGKYTLKELRKIINELGLRGRRGKMLSISNYQYILKNPFYHGLIRYNGEYFEGKHEPIIAKKLFDEAQEVMKQKSKPQKADKMKFFLYRGLFKCGECGFTITADKKIKPSGKSYTYYYCTKKNPNHKCTQNVFTREEKISSQINEAIQKVSLPDDCADWMLKELKKEQKEKEQSSRFFAQKIQDEIKTIDEKLEKLMNAYLENALSLEEYREAKNKLVNQKRLLKDKLAAFEQKSNNRFELAARFINIVKQAEIIALQENPEQGRDFLKKIGSNFRLSGQKLFLDFKNLYKILVNAEPEQSEGEATTLKNSKIVKWRRGRDSNPGYPFGYSAFRVRCLKPTRPPLLFYEDF